MKRPLLLRLIPEHLRTSALFRLYSKQNSKFSALYEKASLSYAPEVCLKLVTGDHISRQIAFTGFYELALTRRIVELAKIGDVMVDVGANLGYFSCLWASGNSRNKCFAFEASPKNTEILQFNINSNGFGPQIELLPIAAGYESGTLTFDVGPEEQTVGEASH